MRSGDADSWVDAGPSLCKLRSASAASCSLLPSATLQLEKASRRGTSWLPPLPMAPVDSDRRWPMPAARAVGSFPTCFGTAAGRASAGGLKRDGALEALAPVAAVAAVPSAGAL